MISSPVLAIAIPFLGGVGAPELIIILVIILVLFGPKRLPQLGKSLGKTMKAIREGAEGKLGEDDDDDEVAEMKVPAAPKKSDAEAKVESKKKDSAEV